MSDSEDDGFKQNPGEALEMGEDQFDSEDQLEEDEEDLQPEPLSKPAPKPAASNIKGTHVDNQHHDLAVDVNDSEEIDSEEEEDEMPAANEHKPTMPQHTQQQQTRQTQMQQKDDEEAEADEDGDKPVPGAYNPFEFANLPVSAEVKELFEYIGRFKPQKIDLETKMKPFVPEFVPAVGEVDALIKMPRPDGQAEEFGITVLDEPCLNPEDKTVLELKYVQSKNVVRATPMEVDSIEQADKKPKEISRWIEAVQGLHKTRPPPTVNYGKAMPDFDSLMAEWPPEMEQAFQQIQFPDSEIDMHTSDYARLICAMCDIPVHKSGSNKSVVESLHVLFTLFVEFRNNQHFKRFEGGADIANF